MNTKLTLCNAFSAACLAAAVFSAGMAVARADVIFGYRNTCAGKPEAALDFSRQGRFFATTDYADNGRDWEALTRARAIDRPGVFPKYYKPWTGDGNRTLVGVRFDSPLKPNYPGQFDRFPDGVPLFTRAVIQWKENVPLKNSWAACIRKPDGSLVKIAVNAGKLIYPRDRTTIEFPPTAINTFYVGIKGREDGLVNYADILDINLYILPEHSSLTNNMLVWQPAFYKAAFSPVSPGMIDALCPVNHYYVSHHSLYYDPHYLPGLFFHMTPFIQYNGTNLFPVKKECPVKVEKSDGDETAEYTLAFELPGKEEVQVAVATAFRASADKSVELNLKAANLPAGARLGYEFYGRTNLFGAMVKANPVMAGGRIDLATMAGRVQIHVPEATPVTLAGAAGSKAGTVFQKTDKVRFEVVSSGHELTLAFSLPVGSAGQPQPEVLKYTWRPSLAGEGDEGIAPFKASDLELVDEIDCGNPDDPHPCFDISNDPAIAALRKKFGTLRERGGQHGPHGLYGYLAFLNNPGEGKIPITTVAGKQCREIPDKFGIYFRYNLKPKIKLRTPYLVVIEHAFDRMRRGEFHSIYLDKDDNLIYGSVLWGGLETGDAPESKYRKESFLCCAPMGHWADESTCSLVFSGVYSAEAGWEAAPGPAVKSVRIYRVKTMPGLPDLAALAPPREKRRSLLCLTEMVDAPNPYWFFQYPRLVGYDGLWTYHDPMSRFFGGSSNLRMSFHPGTLAGNNILFEAAREQGLFVNLHLGQLINLGFGDGDDDSFTGGGHGSYTGESIPLKPTGEELDRIAQALKKSLPALARYPSLKEIALHDEPAATLRNMRDFCAASGIKLNPSPVNSENILALFNGGPDLVRRWMQWACAERYKFHRWLLKEVRQYRPDLTLTYDRGWWWGRYSVFEHRTEDPLPGISRERASELGIKNFYDYLRFCGFDPDLYAGQDWMALELDANRWIRPVEQRWPDLYTRDWFPRVRDDFKAGGLSIMVNLCYEESSKPLRSYSCLFVCSQDKFRKGLIDALRFANAKTINLPTYNEPWTGRIGDLREFVVTFRLLPYAAPELFAGKITDTASQAVINKYGDRFGLVNAGPEATAAELELPAGMTSVTDLSEGVPQKMETIKNKDGKSSVKIALKPWALKTLEMK